MHNRIYLIYFLRNPWRPTEKRRSSMFDIIKEKGIETGNAMGLEVVLEPMQINKDQLLMSREIPNSIYIDPLEGIRGRGIDLKLEVCVGIFTVGERIFGVGFDSTGNKVEALPRNFAFLITKNGRRWHLIDKKQKKYYKLPKDTWGAIYAETTLEDDKNGYYVSVLKCDELGMSTVAITCNPNLAVTFGMSYNLVFNLLVGGGKDGC